MIKNINVKDFKADLFEKLTGYDDYEIISIGKVQGEADELVNPYVILLRDSTGRLKNIYVPSLQDENTF